jgi:hypothetical protein
MFYSNDDSGENECRSAYFGVGFDEILVMRTKLKSRDLFDYCTLQKSIVLQMSYEWVRKMYKLKELSKKKHNSFKIKNIVKTDTQKKIMFFFP